MRGRRGTGEEFANRAKGRGGLNHLLRLFTVTGVVGVRLARHRFEIKYNLLLYFYPNDFYPNELREFVDMRFAPRVR